MLNLTKGSTLDLSKGASLNLSKTETGEKGPNSWIFGLGWDPKKSNWLQSDYDLDASCVLIDTTGKKPNAVVYYGDKRGPGVTHTGDNLTGVGQGDDEQILVDLASVLTAGYDKIVFVVNIYDAQQRRQEFKSVKNAFIRLEANGETFARYNLSDTSKDGVYGMVFAQIVYQSGDWIAQAVGNPLNFIIRDLSRLK